MIAQAGRSTAVFRAVVVFMFCGSLATGCGGGGGNPPTSPSPSANPNASSTASATNTPAATSAASATPSAGLTATPLPTGVLSPTPVPTATLVPGIPAVCQQEKDPVLGYVQYKIFILGKVPAGGGTVTSAIGQWDQQEMEVIASPTPFPSSFPTVAPIAPSTQYIYYGTYTINSATVPTTDCMEILTTTDGSPLPEGGASFPYSLSGIGTDIGIG
ncbi:MAG TPA: hypothetical protein VGD50_02825, partial [Candidatus Baltobacteraceae bacterium]